MLTALRVLVVLRVLVLEVLRVVVPSASFIPERHQRIDARRSTCGDPACGEGDE